MDSVSLGEKIMERQTTLDEFDDRITINWEEDEGYLVPELDNNDNNMQFLW